MLNYEVFVHIEHVNLYNHIDIYLIFLQLIYVFFVQVIIHELIIELLENVLEDDLLFHQLILVYQIENDNCIVYLMVLEINREKINKFIRYRLKYLLE